LGANCRRRVIGAAAGKDRSLSDESGEPWVEVRRFDTLREADPYALVLVAAGMDCRISPRDGRVGLLVAPADALRADYELDAYARDNRLAAPSSPAQRPLRAGLAGAVAYCCVLLLVYGAAGHQALSRDWLADGDAQAGLIVGGEWWRTLTALGLHGDEGHLFSNLVAGSLVGILLAQILGGGLAWLAILLAGGIGNGLSALLQPSSHAAIGASTAVFGGIGLLVVLMVKYQAALWSGGVRRWLPLGVGVMLLAFLGIEGERIDIGGHIAGFLAGCLLGVGLIAMGEPSARRRPGLQLACGAAALALFAGAWVIALAGGASPG
jgi:membrane associated rhomboid family serine protease